MKNEVSVPAWIREATNKIANYMRMALSRNEEFRDMQEATRVELMGRLEEAQAMEAWASLQTVTPYHLRKIKEFLRDNAYILENTFEEFWMNLMN